MKRATGVEERPPIGIHVLPQTILPNAYGSTRAGWIFLPGAGGNIPEGLAGGYAGLIAAVGLMPLGWFAARRRRLCFFWLFIAIVSWAWILNIWGVVQLLRLPGLNVLPHNRFVFGGAFAVLVVAAIGLEELWSRRASLAGMGTSLACLTIIMLWCFGTAADLPALQFRSQLKAALMTGRLRPDVAGRLRLNSLADLERAESNLAGAYLIGAACALLGAGAIVIAMSGPRRRNFACGVLGAVQVFELFLFASSSRVQWDWSRYYPLAPELKKFVDETSDRILPIICMSPRTTEFYGIRDIRGYDASDPRLILEVLDLAREPGIPSPDYALTQNFAPRARIDESGVAIHPAVGMLGVRYVIFPGPLRGTSPPRLVDQGFHVYENLNAMPRVYFPETIELLEDDAAVLAAIGNDAFSPSTKGYVARPDLGSRSVANKSPAQGSAKIEHENPNEIRIRADVTSAGMLVLADLWDAGWSVTVNGKPEKVYRVNHALRGVLLASGESEIVFRYWPPGMTSGLISAAIALGMTIAVALILYRSRSVLPTPVEAVPA